MQGQGASGEKTVKESEGLLTHALKFEQVSGKRAGPRHASEQLGKMGAQSVLERKELLELFFNQSLDGLFFMMLDEPIRWDDSVDKEKTLDYVFARQRMTALNDAMFQQYGATREEFVGLTPGDIFAHDVARARDIWKQLFDAGRLCLVTEERKVDGTPVWIEGDYICLYDDAGRITGHFGCQRDITDHRNAQESIGHCADVVENMQVGLYVYHLEQLNDDRTLRLIRTNPAASLFTGVAMEDVLGKTIDENFPGLRGKGIPRLFAEVVRTGIPTVLEDLYYGDERVIEGAYWVEAFPLSNNCVGVTFENITNRKRAVDALRESETKLRGIIEHSTEVFYVHGTDHTLTYVSPQSREVFGLTPEEMMVKWTTLTTDNPINKKGIELTERAMRTGRKQEPYLLEIRRKDGGSRIVEVDESPVKDEKGRVIAVSGAIKDVTRRKEAENSLREMALFAQLNPAPVLRFDQDGAILLCNDATVQILGDAARKGALLKDVLPALTELNLKQCIRGGLVLREEVRIGNRAYQFVIRGVPDLGLGQIYGSDITDRKKAEDELCGHQLNLKAMASKILQTQERERRLLAVELHDNICQGLVLIKLALESSLHLISDSHVLASVKIACGAIGETIEEADSLTFALSSPVLHQLGFVAALEKHLTEEIQQKYGIECDLECDDRTGALRDEIENCLFRVTRELLTNTVKHAHARKIKVRVRENSKRIRVSVQDNGVGFKDVRAASAAPETTRFGLFSVREQLEYLGGFMKIKSRRGRGTTVTVVVPLEEKADF